MKNGKLYLIIGCMFSGKTSELINRYYRYTIANKKCLMIKYINDTRYDKEYTTTHDGKKVKGLCCKYLKEANDDIKNYDVIFIDEVQFFDDAHKYCELWTLEDNKIIIACGLNGTFNRQPFEIISKLIPLANDITFKTAICKETGKEAIYSKLLGNNINNKNNNIEVIGGTEKYIAADRETFFNDSKELTGYISNLK